MRKKVPPRHLISVRYPWLLRQWVSGTRCPMAYLLPAVLGVTDRFVRMVRQGRRADGRIKNFSPAQLQRAAEFFGVTEAVMLRAIRDARTHYRQRNLIGVDFVDEPPELANPRPSASDPEHLPLTHLS